MKHLGPCEPVDARVPGQVVPIWQPGAIRRYYCGRTWTVGHCTNPPGALHPGREAVQSVSIHSLYFPLCAVPPPPKTRCRSPKTLQREDADRLQQTGTASLPDTATGETTKLGHRQNTHILAGKLITRHARRRRQPELGPSKRSKKNPRTRNQRIDTTLRSCLRYLSDDRTQTRRYEGHTFSGRFWNVCLLEAHRGGSVRLGR